MIPCSRTGARRLPCPAPRPPRLVTEPPYSQPSNGRHTGPTLTLAGSTRTRRTVAQQGATLTLQRDTGMPRTAGTAHRRHPPPRQRDKQAPPKGGGRPTAVPQPKGGVRPSTASVSGGRRLRPADIGTDRFSLQAYPITPGIGPAIVPTLAPAPTHATVLTPTPAPGLIFHGAYLCVDDAQAGQFLARSAKAPGTGFGGSVRPNSAQARAAVRSEY